MGKPKECLVYAWRLGRGKGERAGRAKKEGTDMIAKMRYVL